RAFLRHHHPPHRFPGGLPGAWRGGTRNRGVSVSISSCPGRALDTTGAVPHQVGRTAPLPGRADRPHRRGSAACPATTAHRGTAGPPGGGIPLRTDATPRPGRIPPDTCGPEGPSHIPLRILRETPSAATSTVPAHAFPLEIGRAS